MKRDVSTNRRELADRITADPGVMVGKPVVRGTRIPVERVLEQLAFRPDLEELFAAYPRLTIEDVKACLAYAHQAVSRMTPRRPRPALATSQVTSPATHDV